MEQQEAKQSVCLAGVNICYSFRCPETEKYFESFVCAEPSDKPCKTLYVTDEVWRRHRDLTPASVPDSYTEFYSLLGITSRELLKYGKCLFHGVAFVWQGKAWLITAPSGTGKTTQLLHWQKLFGNEIQLINGDKPVMECREDRSVRIYPSPWNGKEGLSGNASGKLAGIVCLEQADCNEMYQMDIRSSLLPVYQQFLYYGDYEDEIRAVEAMLQTVLETVPVWKLRNLGDEASAQMTHDTLMRYLEENG